LHRASKHVRSESQRGQRAIPAVGTAHNSNFLRIGYSLVYRPIHSVNQIVMHLESPLFIAGVEELLPVAGRAAKIGLENGIAAVGQPLGKTVEAPLSSRPAAARSEQRHRQNFGVKSD